MNLWSDFYDYILPELPQVITQLVDLHIISKTIEFMDKSGIMIVDHTPIDTVFNQATYTLAPPTGYDVARIHEMWFDGMDLAALSEDQMRGRYPQWNLNVDAPRNYLSSDQTTFRLVPIPDEASAGPGRITLRVVLRPQRTQTGIDSWIYNKYVEVISAGVKGALMAMPAKPWSNPQLAVFYTQKFMEGIGAATIEINKGMQRATTRVRPVSP
ncbi:MAG: hypothetical protein KGL39_33465 [Patescibacteria group bacterium]|nr:hypothetical protein [Patescibacteria group bacterium]